MLVIRARFVQFLGRMDLRRADIALSTRSALPLRSPYPTREGDDAMSKVSRRSLVTSAVAISALAVPAVAVANPAQVGAAAADPIYAAISIYIELEEQASNALEVYAKAEELFRAEFGSPPDAVNKEWWDAWDERVKRFYTVLDDACSLWSDAAVGLLATKPTSLGGVQALIDVIRQRPILFDFCKYPPDGPPQLVETLTTALAQAPA
jgi:hypothetical protein